MFNEKKFFNQKNGLYKAMFSVCILVLALVIISVTDNADYTDAGVIDKQQLPEEKPEISTEMLDSVVEEVNNGLSDNKIHNIEPDINEHIPKNKPMLMPPVYGSVIKKYSVNTPVYSKTMNDWRIHQGVDISCNIGSEVYASADGTIEEVGYNMLLGNFVILKSGEYTLKYASLSSDIKLKEGDFVYTGQIIGTIDSSCVGEICDETHLHFEMRKNGELIDPETVIMFD